MSQKRTFCTINAPHAPQEYSIRFSPRQIGRLKVNTHARPPREGRTQESGQSCQARRPACHTRPLSATSCPGPREGGGSGLSIQHACLHDQPIVTILIPSSLIAGGGGDPSRRVVTRSTPPTTAPGDQGHLPPLVGCGFDRGDPPCPPRKSRNGWGAQPQAERSGAPLSCNGRLLSSPRLRSLGLLAGLEGRSKDGGFFFMPSLMHARYLKHRWHRGKGSPDPSARTIGGASRGPNPSRATQ